MVRDHGCLFRPHLDPFENSSCHVLEIDKKERNTEEMEPHGLSPWFSA
jgi:hypothetical protein